MFIRIWTSDVWILIYLIMMVSMLFWRLYIKDVIIVIVSKALHTRKTKLYGCAAVVTCRSHALSLWRDIHNLAIDFIK